MPSATSTICSGHFSPEDYTQRFSFGPAPGHPQLIRDEIGIVPVPKFQNKSLSELKEGVEISGRDRRQILRNALNVGVSPLTSTSIESGQVDVEAAVEEVQNTQQQIACNVEPNFKDHGTQTKDCVGCGKLREQNRQIGNKYISLKEKHDKLLLTSNSKISCGIQCRIEEDELCVNDVVEDVMEADELEFEDNVQVERDYEVMEVEPEEECAFMDTSFNPGTDTDTDTDLESECDGEEYVTEKKLHLNNKNLRTESKFIVFLSNLLLLFTFCPSCKAENPMVKAHQVGTMVVVKTKCHNPKCTKPETVWNSQPNIPGTKIPAGNFLLCFGILLAGASASKVFQVFSHMGLSCITLSTYFEHQRDKLFPTIHLHWKKYQEKIINQIKALGTAITISGDGRHDSMGHSAKFGAYTIFCCTVPLVIHFALVQRNEAGSSGAMEYLGFKRSMAFLLASGLAIATFISDRHTSIAKHMREKLTNITHYFDLWHLKKSVRKALSKISRESGCEGLKDWIKPCLNHLHWSASSTISGNGRIIWAKFRSFLGHIVDKHENLDDPLFNKCSHGVEIKPRKYLLSDSVVYEKVVGALTNVRLIAGIKQASPLEQTSCLEGFHSLLNHFCPKMIAFSYAGMFCRHVLAVMHFNYNLVRETKKKANGESQVRFIYPKFLNGEASVRDVRIQPNFDYVEEIFETFLEANSQKGTHSDAAKELQEMTPLPMNSMLIKESKETALARKQKRKSMTVEDVPPTVPLSEVLAQEKMTSNKGAKKKKAAPHCNVCKNPMKGHKLVKDCPRNMIDRQQ